MEFRRAGIVLRKRQCVRVNKVCEHFSISRVMAVNLMSSLVTLGDSNVLEKEFWCVMPREILLFAAFLERRASDLAIPNV